MKKENISEIISSTDEKYIEEAVSPVKKKKTTVKITAIAASLAVLLIAGITVSRTDFIKHYEEQSSSGEVPSGVLSPMAPQAEIATSPLIGIVPDPEIATSPAIEIAPEGEMAILPRWEELSTAQKFPELKTENRTYSTTAQPIADEYIAELISDTSLSGYDLYEDKQYSEQGKIYSITNISSECAVAVKIGEESTYYVYVNSDYSPLTLGDFINDLDLRSTLVFGNAYKDTYEFTDTSSSHTRRTYEDFDDSIIWDMLLSDTKASRTEYKNPFNGIDISISLPLLGYNNISFDITDDGYIVTNILGTQKCFFIGTEKSAEFNKYLEKNVKFNETTDVYEYPPSTPGTGEVVSPGYNPDMPVTSPAFDPEWSNNSQTGNASTPAAAPAPTPAPAPEPVPVPDSFIVVETTQIR